MALIKCPECGRDVSDKSNACIHCGFPLSSPKKGELIVRGKRTIDAFKKHIYFLYYEDGTFFDEILPGEVKHYVIDKRIYLVLGHKRGSFVNSAVKDSMPVKVEPGKITRLEASIGQELFMPGYLLSIVDVIASD